MYIKKIKYGKADGSEKKHLCCFCNQLKELIFSTSGYGKSANDKNSNYEQKIDELQTDLNTTRVKLIEKEREVERLDAQVKTSAKSSPTAKGKLSRSGSQEEDLQKKIQVIEKEANLWGAFGEPSESL
jgi:septal ring factor EnvC (AmiA/AmiB activator)